MRLDRRSYFLAAGKADRSEDATKEASVAKPFAGEMDTRVTAAASAMLGSVGYTGQSSVESCSATPGTWPSSKGPNRCIE